MIFVSVTSMLHLSMLGFLPAIVILSRCVTSEDVSLQSFKECLVSKPSGNVGYCFGVGALTKLQSIEDDDHFNVVDGIQLSRDEQQYREEYNFADSDPSNFRTIIHSMDQVFSKRTLRWDMSFIHPGLAIRMAPSIHSGGVLEFILDPHSKFATENLKEVTTGRLIARQFLVPMLLGLKLNIATVFPIIFGIIALIAKKFLVVSKIGLIVSTAYALGSLMFGYNNLIGSHNHQSTFNPSFGGHYDSHPLYADSLYRNKQDKIGSQGNIQPEENYSIDSTKGRNFAWSENENKT